MAEADGEHSHVLGQEILMTLGYNTNQSTLMLGLHQTPEGLETDLRPKNDQTRGYSGVGRQGRMFLLCYSSEGHKLLLDTRNNSGLLAIEEFMPIDLRMACEGRELASLSWRGRKSLLLLGQLYTFCLLVCQSLPEIDVNASLRSDDKSFTTAHESKKSIIFQLLNLS